MTIDQTPSGNNEKEFEEAYGQYNRLCGDSSIDHETADWLYDLTKTEPIKFIKEVQIIYERIEAERQFDTLCEQSLIDTQTAEALERLKEENLQEFTNEVRKLSEELLRTL